MINFLQFLHSEPCWQWHRPLTLSNYDDGLPDTERQNIYVNAEIAAQEIANYNTLRFKELGPAFVPRQELQ